MLTALSWFPPAPAAGPKTLLELPPDDWALEPKINGIRVVVIQGMPFARTGQPLSPGKGAARLRQLVGEIPENLDGEWVMGTGCFHLFDLPGLAGDYDERHQAVQDLVAKVRNPQFMHVHSFTANFPQVYQSLKQSDLEGVVLKRRRSLYQKQTRSGVETRDWLKRRFLWDLT